MTTTDTSSPAAVDHQPMIDAYFDAWNTTDADERRSFVERTYVPDAHLVDPLVDVTGHDQLVELFTNFHVTYAGHSFRQAGGVDAHHDLVRWGWEMLDASGNVVLDGLDVALVAEGRISYVAGFFGAALPQ
jgi:hypothetical protein